MFVAGKMFATADEAKQWVESQTQPDERRHWIVIQLDPSDPSLGEQTPVAPTKEGGNS